MEVTRDMIISTKIIDLINIFFVTDSDITIMRGKLKNMIWDIPYEYEIKKEGNKITMEIKRII